MKEMIGDSPDPEVGNGNSPPGVGRSRKAQFSESSGNDSIPGERSYIPGERSYNGLPLGFASVKASRKTGVTQSRKPALGGMSVKNAVASVKNFAAAESKRLAQASAPTNYADDAAVGGRGAGGSADPSLPQGSGDAPKDGAERPKDKLVAKQGFT